MKLVKIAAAVGGGLLVLLAAAVLVAAWLFDPNDYKGALAAEFEQRTGRTLVIERDLGFEYLPWLALETGDVRVGNAPGFSNRDFARVETLEARVRLLPLVLERRVRVGTIVLEGLVLNLEIDGEGRRNWMLTGADPAADRGAAPRAGAREGWLEALDVDGLRIRDAEVNWRELGTERAYAVSGLSVTTGAYRPGEPVDIEAAFRIADSATAVDATVETHATVDYAPGAGLAVRAGRLAIEASLADRFTGAGDWRFDSIDWRTDAPLTMTGAELTGWVEAPALGGERHDIAAVAPRVELDLLAGRLGVDELTTSIDALDARWQISGESLLDAARIDGRLALDEAPLAEAMRLLAARVPDGVDAAALGSLDLTSRFALTLDPFGLELTDLDARALGAAVTGSATLNGPGPRVTASLAAPAFAPSGGLRALLAPHVPEGVALDAFDRIAFSAEVDADVPARTLALRELSAELLGATLTGRADISMLDGDLTARGRLAASGLAPGAFDAAFGELLTDTIDRRELGTLAFDAGFGYDGPADRLTLDPLALDAFGLSATGALTASALSTAPVYTGRASVETFEPRDLMRRFGQPPPETSDPAALASARIDTRFEITPERGDFRELVLGLDDSRITGEFVVEDFENPSYGFTLAIDALDADRYMAPRADDAADGERTAGDLELTSEVLDVLRLDGRVNVGMLELAGLSFEQVTTRIELGGGAVRLDDARAELYGGRFDGAFGVDASGDTPTMTLTGRVENLDLAPLITDLTGDANFSGTAALDLSLSGTGVTVTDNVRSAAGTMGFTMRDGAIEGFDLGRALCSAYNTTQSLPKPPEPDVERTRYTLLRGTADVSDGVATSPDLLARTPFMDVTGRGGIDLVEQALDYELEAELTAPIDIPRCESMDRLVGDSIPLTLRGTMTNPRILPDFGEILRRRVQDELRDRATESLEDRVRERLRDLF